MISEKAWTQSTNSLATWETYELIWDDFISWGHISWAIINYNNALKAVDFLIHSLVGMLACPAYLARIYVVLPSCAICAHCTFFRAQKLEEILIYRNSYSDGLLLHSLAKRLSTDGNLPVLGHSRIGSRELWFIFPALVVLRISRLSLILNWYDSHIELQSTIATA